MLKLACLPFLGIHVDEFFLGVTCVPPSIRTCFILLCSSVYLKNCGFRSQADGILPVRILSSEVRNYDLLR